MNIDELITKIKELPLIIEAQLDDILPYTYDELKRKAYKYEDDNFPIDHVILKQILSKSFSVFNTEFLSFTEQVIDNACSQIKEAYDAGNDAYVELSKVFDNVATQIASSMIETSNQGLENLGKFFRINYLSKYDNEEINAFYRDVLLSTESMMEENVDCLMTVVKNEIRNIMEEYEIKEQEQANEKNEENDQMSDKEIADKIKDSTLPEEHKRVILDLLGEEFDTNTTYQPTKVDDFKML